MKIIIIVGLPGSGKTYLGKELSQGGDFIDDISIHGLKSLENVTKDLLVITDPYLCRQTDRTKAQIILSKKFPNCKIEWIYFENDVQKCINNVNKRFNNGDKRKVLGLIAILSKEYNPPFYARKICA